MVHLHRFVPSTLSVPSCATPYRSFQVSWELVFTIKQKFHARDSSFLFLLKMEKIPLHERAFGSRRIAADRNLLPDELLDKT